MIQYKFKDPSKEYQYKYLHPKVREDFELLCHILNKRGYAVVITSMVRPKDTIPGESGVHATGRALDCVPIATRKSGPMSFNDMSDIAYFMTKAYPRMDDKAPVIWHEVPGGNGYHFHIQAEYGADYRDLRGDTPKD